jgi:hypothetical protein|tara:strand:+ start:2751 stop:3545 length:795 start_codon:yes stop_codon:yes gene_type:complete
MSLLGSLGLGFLGSGFRKPLSGSISWSPGPSANEATDGDYTILSVTSNSTLTVTGTVAGANFLMVGQGGGSGPQNYGGGGGGGGVVYATNKMIGGGSYPVVIGNNVTFNGFTALAGGPTGATGGHDPTGSITTGRPGGSGGGAGRSGGQRGPLNQGGAGLQPAQSQPTPATQYGNPGFGPAESYNGTYATNGGGGAGSGGPRTTRSTSGGNGQAINITGSNIDYGAGAGSPPRNGPGTSFPSANGRGGGGSKPGTVIIRYIKSS